MIKHGHSACATCHADPSGAGLLTQYGRAQSELLLSTRYGETTKGGEEEEASRFSQALFGIVDLPEALVVGGWVRNGFIWNTADGNLVDTRFLQMRADLAAQLKVGHFRASGSLGYASPDSAPLSQEAWVTTNLTGPHLVSREHWLGWDVNDEILVRAGRMNLPFGLRNIEHTSWVRAETLTDINQSQQHGASASISNEHVRAEVMGIAGNFQLNPDAYRERGGSGYAELSLAKGQAAGVSAKVTHAAADLNSRQNVLRQAHGAFARLSYGRLAVLAEADLLITSLDGAPTRAGFVSWLQADFEPIQGLHGMAAAETLRRPHAGDSWGWGAWVTAAWFFLPHFDVRGDIVRRGGLGGFQTMTYLIQLHGYL
jgi:hypothetical protein